MVRRLVVEFWKWIFLRYDSSQLVFFDPRSFSRIYEVVKVGPYANARKVFRSVRRRITRHMDERRDPMAGRSAPSPSS